MATQTESRTQTQTQTRTLAGWHIELEFSERGGRTKAAALLRLRDGNEVRAHGHATRHPDDPTQQRVGEEVAAARALDDLARQLLAKAGGEIEETTHRHAYLAM
ncbi:dsRBD fold-containing protein [Streptomyces sp. NPDC092296]|uniref:dsRBD fold-containing protein n=1 Tax=Streptomyces sp. NPDC092296 TaxID=3366012 RepID=UPI0037F12047